MVDSHNKIEYLYDLKGSMINRLVYSGENQTKKDRNFLLIKKNRRKSGE